MSEECRYMSQSIGSSVKNTQALWNLSLIINGIPLPHSPPCATQRNPRERSGVTGLVKRGKMAFRLFLHKVSLRLIQLTVYLYFATEKSQHQPTRWCVVGFKLTTKVYAIFEFATKLKLFHVNPLGYQMRLNRNVPISVLSQIFLIYFKIYFN